MDTNQNSEINREEEKNKKVILLDLSRTERAFEEEESLWDIEIKKIEDRLEGHIDSLKKYENEKDIRKKPLLSIAILGYPGSGKTSMLHTLVDCVNREKSGEAFLNNVYSLPMIKPNLVAEDDHFLYAFLAEALREDRKQYQNEEARDSDTQFTSRVQHEFQEVSEYLQVLNKSRQTHEGDPLGVSLERLDRHESGLMLIDKMAGFIDELANSLGRNRHKSIVLLPVDDADMSKEVLISALDTCWRFIKHPRLVPIFTFSGRLAEELLRVNYDDKLNRGSSLEKLKEASTAASVTGNMAIQHLGKLFPVRNRIKMGPASARVQAAEYKPLKEGSNTKIVSKLLETASKLLFGHAPLFADNHIRPPLRMVTLRRQIQIVDAIQGTGIEQFMETTETEELKPWSEIFDLAAWSLLNAHRDVLKEIDLNLDDLYSWTPKGLRQVILDRILMQSKDDLRKLHKHWRYRTDDRRSQIISLLAANVFRPRMDEEPTADDAHDIIRRWWGNYKRKDKNEKKYKYKLEVAAKSFPVIKGGLWFLNLYIGFYLPQVFSWSGLRDSNEKDVESNRVTGIGWGLLSGPLLAVQEALKKKKVFSSGMLFLDPEKFDTFLKDNNQNKNKRFLIHIWCYYGFHDEWPWTAISLWRGLGLMGKVIEIFENHRKCSDDHTKCLFTEDGSEKEELKNKIVKIIKRHFDSARVFSNLPKGKDIGGKYQELDTEDWEYKDDAETALDTDEDSMKNRVPNFADAMISWLEANCSTLIEKGEEKKRNENRISPMEEKNDEKENKNWESCFIRRLHGDGLMSTFLQRLENRYFKKNLKDWTAGSILYHWKKVLNQYWEGCEKIKALFESCPVWPDYESHYLYNPESPGQTGANNETTDLKKPNFGWGAVKVSSSEKYGMALNKRNTKMNIRKDLEAVNAKYIDKFADGDENELEDITSRYIKEIDKSLRNLYKKYTGRKIKSIKKEIKTNKKKFIKKLKAEIQDFNAKNEEFDKEKKEYDDFLEKLGEEKKNLTDAEGELAKEAKKETKEDNKDAIETLKKDIKKYSNKIETIHSELFEKQYNRRIGIPRADLKDYKLFDDDQKPSKQQLEGDLNISEATESDSNKKTGFKVVVSNAIPGGNENNESEAGNDKNKKTVAKGGNENNKSKAKEGQKGKPGGDPETGESGGGN